VRPRDPPARVTALDPGHGMAAGVVPGPTTQPYRRRQAACDTFGAACCGAPAATEVSAALQRYRGAARHAGGSRPLSAIGLVFRRALADTVYATAQAWVAFDGRAGAFSVGLSGLGAAWPLDDAGRWRAGVEGLVGAAGGGGVSSAGSAVVQPMAWADAALGRTLRLRVGAGVIRSVKGELSTPVAEVALTVPLGRR
jgi:hypothetical protein